MKNKLFLTLGLTIMALMLVACGKDSPKAPSDKQGEFGAIEEDDSPSMADVETDIPDNNDLDTEEEDVKDEDAEEFTIKEYNEFVAKSYQAIFKDWLKKDKSPDKKDTYGGLVYSPYSYKKALEGLSHVTDGFKTSEYLSKAIYSQAPTKISNINTGTVTMLNNAQFKTTDKKIKPAGFPDEAQKYAKDLQRTVLGKILLKPDYDEDLSIVILNATKFHGKWKKPFDAEMTEEMPFNNFYGKEIKKETMFAEDLDKAAYKDDMVSVGRKELKTSKKGSQSFVYFISPEDYKKEDLEKIVENIPKYIEEIEKVADRQYSKYARYFEDGVSVSIPRINLKSNIDILKAEKDFGSNDITKPFKEKSSIKRIGNGKEPLQVSGIQQIATIKMDEEEVKAEAVTEVEAVMTSLAPEEKEDKLFIDCKHPHFIVTVSDGVISFIGFVAN